MDRRGRLAHAGFVLLVVPLVAVCALGVTWRYAAIAVANLAPLGLLALQLRRGRHTDRTGWSLLLAGAGALAVHNLHNLAAVVATGEPAVGPSAGATLIAGYTLLVVGGLLVTVPFARRDAGGVLDAAVIGLAAASLMWVLVLHPAHVRLGSGTATMVYQMALVVMVTALTGGVLRVAFVARAARTPALYLLVAMGATNVADAFTTLTTDPATGLAAWWVDALCVVALLAFAAALAHPSARAVARADRPARGLTPARLTFLALALAVEPALVGVQHLRGHPADVVLLSAGALLMVPLVASRIGLLARWHAEAESRLHDLALLDDLTGLPNRRAMTGYLADLLDRVAAGTSPGVVLVYLDLDDFKAVNDTHGHATGDSLLRAIGQRVRARVRAADLVARFGGDEFVVVVEGSPDGVEPALVATLELALAEPVLLGSLEVPGRASIGIAAARPGERLDVPTLIGLADADMYRVKRVRHDSQVQVATTCD